MGILVYQTHVSVMKAGMVEFVIQHSVFLIVERRVIVSRLIFVNVKLGGIVLLLIVLVKKWILFCSITTAWRQ